MGAKAIRDGAAAGAANVALVDPRGVGGCRVATLILGLTGSADGDGEIETSRVDVLGSAVGRSVSVGAGTLVNGAAVGVLVVVGTEVTPSGAGDSALGNTGFPAVPDVIELVCAPPVLCTTPVRGSGVAGKSADDELSVVVGEVGETVVSDGEVEPDGGVDADDGPDELEDDEVDELESDGPANATPGMLATADPTPSATANAPTRPT